MSMPKSFSNTEREHIKSKLIEVAEECLLQYGLKKTTVDEIVQRAKIPKGTFYLFYASKELLFFDVFIAFHDRIHTELFAEINEIHDDVTPEQVTQIIFGLYKKVENSFLFRFFMGGDLELLFRKLPQEAIDAHADKDDLSIRQLVSLVPGIKEEKAEVFSAALRAVFTSMMYRREVGEALFDDALKIMIHGIVLQMFAGVEND
jgi:AcrR family transcriptional regulator